MGDTTVKSGPLEAGRSSFCFDKQIASRELQMCAARPFSSKGGSTTCDQAHIQRERFKANEADRSLFSIIERF